jgi:hypothetical protein
MIPLAQISTLGLTSPDTVDMRVLAANVAERHTVPAGATTVLIQGAGDVTDGSGAEYKPDLRGLRNLTSFSIIAPATNVVSLSFFAKPA